MDRVSCLAYLLFQENNAEIKEAALQLVSGDTSIKELKKMKELLPYIQEAEKNLKQMDLNRNDVYEFVENYLYAY
jgi:Leucine-rich repeat (LRR) protein